MTDGSDAARREEARAPWFEDLEVQAHAAHVGMWVFLGSELLLFAGVFALYAGYRAGNTEAFRAASTHTDFALGALMTGVLLTGSLFAALAAAAIRAGRRGTPALLAAAAASGALFLGLKLTEYAHHVRDGVLPTGGPGIPHDPAGGERIFWALYYAGTGLHMVHVTVGVLVLLVLAALVARGRLGPDRAHVVENGCDYWHLVDLVWLFLWPAFYLM